MAIPAFVPELNPEGADSEVGDEVEVEDVVAVARLELDEDFVTPLVDAVAVVLCELVADDAGGLYANVCTGPAVLVKLNEAPSNVFVMFLYSVKR